MSKLKKNTEPKHPVFVFKSATLLLTHATDKLQIDTDLPYAVWPYEGQQTLNMEIAKGEGLEYCRKNFGIEPRIINAS